MAKEEQESERGFRVQDRRRFSPDTGEPRAEETAHRLPEEGQPEQKRSEQDEKVEEAHSRFHDPISFSSFILGLITQALMLMGEVHTQQGQAKQVDLSAARQMIDLLAMLKQKTRGNLDSAEDKLLEDALFDLRMRYVQAVKR